MKSLKNLSEKNWVWLIVILFFPIFFGAIIIIIGEIFYPIKDIKTFGIIDSISDLNSASLIILTLFLVCGTGILALISWSQISKLNKTTNNDFLLRIDNRYNSKSIIKARKVIHDIYIDTDSKGICLTTHILRISEKIRFMDGNKDKSKKFICLLNFLDFLETVAYFTNHGSIQQDELKELLGGSLVFYYKVFRE